MLPGQTSLKTIRDAQRGRSLGLSAQQRQHLSSAAGAGARSSSATTTSGSKLVARPRGGPAWKGVESAAAKKALEEEVREGRGLLVEEGEGVGSGAASKEEGGSSEEEGEGERKTGMGPVEVPLQELVRPARGRHISNDFEIIRHVKGVIALDAEEEFGASSSAELGASAEEEDEWELLGLEDGEEGSGKEVKPQGKTWASIVGRS